jgi:transposase
MSQTSIITGPERRRSWSEEQKLELLAQAFGPGGSVADVARRADICTSLLYRWRQLMRAAPTPPGFIPAVLNEDTGPLPSVPPPGPTEAAICVVLGGRVTVTISKDASPALVTAALGALR